MLCPDLISAGYTTFCTRNYTFYQLIFFFFFSKENKNLGYNNVGIVLVGSTVALFYY